VDSRLLVLRLSALGDVIHTIPAVVALRASHPGVPLSWVVEAPYQELVELVAGVEAIPVRLKKWGREPLASRDDVRRAFRKLRGAATSVDFQGLVKSAMLGWLSGARTRIGFASGAIREKPALLFTNRKVPVDTAKHVVDQNLELAAAAGAILPPPEVPWERFPADPEGKLAAFRGATVLLPGAGKANKLWPVERFRELARQIGENALVVWGPGERELAEAIGARTAPPTNLRELAFILREARAVVGADTGPLHLAAALGTTVVGLYGPTDPRRNGPYGQVTHCIERYHSTKLMESITVEEVVNALRKVKAW
jgi:lipopolysaccharide heptosyltransferase I